MIRWRNVALALALFGWAASSAWLLGELADAQANLDAAYAHETADFVALQGRLVELRIERDDALARLAARADEPVPVDCCAELARCAEVRDALADASREVAP